MVSHFFIINDDSINFLMHKSLSDTLFLNDRIVKLLKGRTSYTWKHINTIL